MLLVELSFYGALMTGDVVLLFGYKIFLASARSNN